MTSLAFEFSFDYRSVAVEHEGRCSEAQHKVGRHTPILNLVDRALKMAGADRTDVGRVVVGLGPGSYTGVRLAISAAQGWQLARGVSTWGLSSFEGLARVAARLDKTRITLAVDAQRQEMAVSVVEFLDRESPRVGPLLLVGWDELRRRFEMGEVVVGPGLPQLLGVGMDLKPSAIELLAALPTGAAPVPAESMTPIYLREANFMKAPPRRDLGGVSLDVPSNGTNQP